MTDTKVGRPKIEFSEQDWEKIIGLIRIQCTAEEICGIFGFSEDTLSRRIQEADWLDANSFAELYKKHQHEGKASLRRAQWKAAMDGNPTMLVWLGKNNLGQTDQQAITLSGDSENPLVFGWEK